MIYIIIEGGVVQNVCTDSPCYVPDVQIIDYDTDGDYDKDDLTELDTGAAAIVSTWGKDQIQTIKPIKEIKS